jgi:uncharacterized protein (TIGR00290 family)
MAAVSGRPRALLSWSSGKDSAYALSVLRDANELDVVGLVTTLNADAGRVAMHAVRERLLDLQASAVGLPVWKVAIPSPCSNEEYDAAMTEVVERAVRERITHMAYGDLFLADIRTYREDRLAGTGISPVFPLWGRDTSALAREMVAAGVRAVLTCVDPAQLDASFAGQSFDGNLLARLPSSCDPCGERGEFHTFAWHGPGFEHPVRVTAGEVVERDGFVFADLLPS